MRRIARDNRNPLGARMSQTAEHTNQGPGKRFVVQLYGVIFDDRAQRCVAFDVAIGGDQQRTHLRSEALDDADNQRATFVKHPSLVGSTHALAASTRKDEAGHVVHRRANRRCRTSRLSASSPWLAFATRSSDRHARAKCQLSPPLVESRSSANPD